jgi:hypothetical protein
MPVIGCCNSPPNLVVISQFMPVGSLYQVLHEQDGSGLVVDTARALQFAIDVAKGMAYLHSLDRQMPRFHLNSKHIMVRIVERILLINFVSLIPTLCSCRLTASLTTSCARASTWPTADSRSKRRARCTSRSGWPPRRSLGRPSRSTPRPRTCGALQCSCGSWRPGKFRSRNSLQWRLE